MSIDHVSKVLNLPPDVTKTDRMVLIVLAEAANQDTNECWPSTMTIRKRAGLQQDRYVQKAVASLSEMGLIEVDPNGCPDERIPVNRRPNLYRMVGKMAVIGGGARRAGSAGEGARRASEGVRDALFAPHIEPEVEPEHSAPAPEQPPLSDDLAASHRRPPPPSRFDEFWTVYPLHTAKGAARREWAKAVKRADPEVIIAAAVRYRDEPKRKREPEWTKRAGGWLADDRWDDEPTPAPSSEVIEH